MYRIAKQSKTRPGITYFVSKDRIFNSKTLGNWPPSPTGGVGGPLLFLWCSKAKIAKPPAARVVNPSTL